MALPALPVNPLLQPGSLVCEPLAAQGTGFPLGGQGRTIGPSPLLFQTKDKPGSGIPLHSPTPSWAEAGRERAGLPPWARAEFFP